MKMSKVLKNLSRLAAAAELAQWQNERAAVEVILKTMLAILRVRYPEIHHTLN